MTKAETLRQEVQTLYERVTGQKYPTERFQQTQFTVPNEIDSLPFLEQQLEALTRIVEQCESACAPPTWAPAIEVRENASHLQIFVELPGFQKEDISVYAGSNLLRVSGNREAACDTDEARVLCERNYGPFERWIPLPFAITSEEVTVQFENGMLSLSVEKKAQPTNPFESVKL